MRTGSRRTQAAAVVSFGLALLLLARAAPSAAAEKTCRTYALEFPNASLARARKWRAELAPHLRGVGLTPGATKPDLRIKVTVSKPPVDDAVGFFKVNLCAETTVSYFNGGKGRVARLTDADFCEATDKARNDLKWARDEADKQAPQLMKRLVAELGTFATQTTCAPAPARPEPKEDPAPITKPATESPAPKAPVSPSQRGGGDQPWTLRETILIAAPLGALAVLLVGAIPLRRRWRQRRIFICYRRTNEMFAARLHGVLDARFGTGVVFRDRRGIDVGTSFPQALEQAVERAWVVVAVIGPDWLQQLAGKQAGEIDYLRGELTDARELARAVVPIFVDGAQPFKEGELPEDLRFLQPVEGWTIPNGSQLEDQERLFKGIGKQLRARLGRPRAAVRAAKSLAPAMRGE